VSVAWWEHRYAKGGDSGPGSTGDMGRFKADTVNEFVAKHQIDSVFDVGCGDGEQVALLNVPCYVGYDPSSSALARAAKRLASDPTKAFTPQPHGYKAELALSMDVLYHLENEAERKEFLDILFALATRFVMIYTTRDNSHDGHHHIWHSSPPDGWIEKIDSPFVHCSFFVYAIPDQPLA